MTHYFQCILMQDKQKKDYCIACSELEGDTTKDDPGKYIYLEVSTIYC